MATINEDKVKSLTGIESEKLLGKETFRIRTNEIICEYVNSVDFMKKVREYSGMEFDSRMFTSFKYWGVVLLTSILTSGVGFFTAKFFK